MREGRDKRTEMIVDGGGGDEMVGQKERERDHLGQLFEKTLHLL